VKEKDGGGRVHFQANRHRKRVRKLRIKNIKLVCDQGSVRFSHRMHPRKKRLKPFEGDLTFSFNNKIKHGASVLRVFVGGGLLKSHHYRKAVGLIHTSGDLNASQTDCRVDGLPLNRGARWRAHRR
jgi:hypothetical protein